MKKLWFLLFFVLAQASVAAPIHIQGNALQGTSAGATTVVVTLASTVASGDTVMGLVSSLSGVTITSVKDDKSNTYTVEDTVTDSTNGTVQATYYLINITNAPKTITVTFSGSTTFRSLAVDEYSGIASLDVHTAQLQASVGTGANAVTSGNVTTTASGDLIYGATVQSANSAVPSVGTGFTQRQSGAVATDDPFMTEDLTQGSAGSVAATFTASATGGAWSSFVLAFMASSGIAPKSNNLSILGVQ